MVRSSEWIGKFLMAPTSLTTAVTDLLFPIDTAEWIENTLKSSTYQKVLLSSSLFEIYLKKCIALVRTYQLMVSKQKMWEADASGWNFSVLLWPEELRHSTGSYFEPSVLTGVGNVQQLLGGPQRVSRPGLFLGYHVWLEPLRVNKQQLKNKLWL